MKLIIFVIIMLLVNCDYLFGQQLYKHQLRGMHEREKSTMIEQSVLNNYDAIYDKILDCAIKGKYEFQFTIMCNEIFNVKNEDDCLIHNGHQVWSKSHPNNVISNYGITIEQYTEILINMINETFPDSDIIKKNKNCCEYYVIKW